MRCEILLPGLQNLRMRTERPKLDDLAAVAATQPIAEAVAGNGAGERAGKQPAEVQRSGSHQGAGEEHRRAARNEGADDGDRLQEGGKENDRQRPFRVAAEQMQQVKIRVLHLPLRQFSAMSESNAIGKRAMSKYNLSRRRAVRLRAGTSGLRPAAAVP